MNYKHTYTLAIIIYVYVCVYTYMHYYIITIAIYGYLLYNENTSVVILNITGFKELNNNGGFFPPMLFLKHTTHLGAMCKYFLIV